LDDAEIASAMETLQRKMMEKQMAQREEAAKENLREGQEFLSENAQKDGVRTTESGLQYEVIEKGSGKTPTPESTVTVHYRGTLIDGTEFDSSYRRGEPATFPVNGVIAGWTEALQLMSEGAKYKLYIPADLAYGERGAGQAIGPNETLIFDVELISVK
jgi:FKBP-type peptidyl-prolyl cis-trans isomerase FklB